MKKKEDVQTVPSIPQQICEIVRKHIPEIKSTKVFLLNVQKDLNKLLGRSTNVEGAFSVYFDHALHRLEPEAQAFFDGFYCEHLKNSKDSDFWIAYYTLRLLGLEDLVMLDKFSSYNALGPDDKTIPTKPRKAGKTSSGATIWDMTSGQTVTPFSDLRFDFVREVASIAKYDHPVLIIGDTGTSKDLVAQAIHRLSARSEKEYLPINCRDYPEDGGILEADLFGYEKGMFTGGHPKGKVGLLEEVNGGVVFLDELGKMPLHLQAKLLRAIDPHTKEIRKMGGRKNINIDVRFIAAIQPKDADEILPDLKWRLGYRDHLYMTPLKERLNRIKGDPARDIIIKVVNNVLLGLGLSEKIYKITVSEGALKSLIAFDFPGNYRELESILRRAVRRLLDAGRNVIMPDDLSLDSHASIQQQNAKTSATDEIDNISLREIFKYADSLAGAIVEKKISRVLKDGLNLKQALEKEVSAAGDIFTVSLYQQYRKDVERYCKKSIREIQKGIPLR